MVDIVTLYSKRPDSIKIDRSFVKHITRSPRDHEIVVALIAMSHALGITVIAEGIETHQQLELLTRMGCDQGQGFLLGRPMPPIAIAEMMNGTPPT